MENNYINTRIKLDDGRIFMHSTVYYNEPILQYSYKRKVMIFFLIVKILHKGGYRQGGFKLY